ncbi:MAG: hypothetical protein M0Z66_13080 [Thermaerobacter sp.]|nr:hypothetical protein [Thermaerobacter sp.]
MSVARVTFSLPESDVRELRNLATKWGTTSSGAVARLIADYRSRQLDLAMAEGYAALAKEQATEAQSALMAQAEVVLRD